MESVKTRILLMLFFCSKTIDCIHSRRVRTLIFNDFIIIRVNCVFQFVFWIFVNSFEKSSTEKILNKIYNIRLFERGNIKVIITYV